MNFWQIVSDHWIIALFVFCGILSASASWSFKMWNRFMRMLMVRKHGWPPEHIDADGDAVEEDDEEEESNTSRLVAQIHQELTQLRGAYATSTRLQERAIFELRDTLIHLVRQMAQMQAMPGMIPGAGPFGPSGGGSASMNPLAEAYQQLMATQMGAELPQPSRARGGRRSAAEARVTAAAAGPATASPAALAEIQRIFGDIAVARAGGQPADPIARSEEVVQSQLSIRHGGGATGTSRPNRNGDAIAPGAIRPRRTPAVQEPEPRPTVSVAEAVSQADLDLGADNTNEGQPQTIAEVARNSGGDLAPDSDETIRGEGEGTPDPSAGPGNSGNGVRDGQRGGILRLFRPSARKSG